MAEKKLTVRFATGGGQQVRTEMQGLGQAGAQAFQEIERGQKSAADSAAIFEAALDREEQAFRDLMSSLDPAYAATRRYEAAVEQATQAVRAGVATQEEANRVIAMARGRMDTLGTAVVAGGRGMASYQGQIQNAAFQIGDFAVQVGAGTAASIALAQQLPQLLGGFGVLGAVLGAAVAIAVPMGRALFSMGEEAETAEERIGRLSAAIDDYVAAAEAAQQSGADLTEQYRSMADEAVRALRVIENLERTEAQRTLQAVVDDIAASLGEMANAVIDAQDAVDVFNRGFALGGLMDSLDIMSEMEAEALKLAQALVNLGQAEGPRQVAAAAQEALDALVAAVGPISQMEGAAAELADQLAQAIVEASRLQATVEGTGVSIFDAAAGAIQFGSNLAGAQGPASSLLGTMQGLAGAAWNAARAMAAQDAANDAGRTASYELGATEDARGNTGNIQNAINAQRIADAEARYGTLLTGDRSGGGSPGGGSSGGEDQGLSPWFDAEQEQQILDMYDAFTQAQEDYNRAVEDGASQVTDLFMSILDGAESAKKALADLLLQMAEVQFQKAILGLAEGNSFISSALAALSGATTAPTLPVPEFDGGGYTGSAPRSGGLDGRGGFLAMMHPQETVIDHTKGQSSGAVTINVNVTGTSGDKAIEEAVARGVSAGISNYDRQLNARIRQINRHSRDL